MESAADITNESKREAPSGGPAEPFERPLADESVDVSGLTCPVLGLTQVRALEQIEQGQVLEVTSRESSVQRIVDWVVAHSGSGDIDLIDVESSSVRAETQDGDILFSGTIADTGDYGFFVHDGDATIAIPSSSRAQVSVSTFDGEFESVIDANERRVLFGSRDDQARQVHAGQERCQEHQRQAPAGDQTHRRCAGPGADQRQAGDAAREREADGRPQPCAGGCVGAAGHMCGACYSGTGIDSTSSTIRSWAAVSEPIPATCRWAGTSRWPSTGAASRFTSSGTQKSRPSRQAMACAAR